MKKLILLITIFSVCLSLQVNAQNEKVKSSKSNSSEKMKGYPPHGYPCLGCAPCVPATNPVSYCDNTAAKLTPHPDALVLGFVFNAGKMIPLATILMKADVIKKMADLGGGTGNTRQAKVKCACGTDIYGKDEAACTRICDFLKDYK